MENQALGGVLVKEFYENVENYQYWRTFFSKTADSKTATLLNISSSFLICAKFSQQTLQSIDEIYGPSSVSAEESSWNSHFFKKVFIVTA